MILYRNTKVKVRSPDGNTDYFDIVAWVQQGDTLAPCLFIICLDNVLRTSIDKIQENGFKITKERSKRYPAKTITDTDYADDIALMANAPTQAETLLHSLERAPTGIGLHVTAHKTRHMCFNQTGDISTLNGSFLKLVDKFPYLGSSASSSGVGHEIRLSVHGKLCLQNWFAYSYFCWRKGCYFHFRVQANYLSFFFPHPVRRFIQTTISMQYIPFFIHPVRECKHVLALILSQICEIGCQELNYLTYSSLNSQSLVAY